MDISVGPLLQNVPRWHRAYVECNELYDKAGCTPRPRDRDRRPSRPGWRDQMQWGRRCVHTSLSWRCGCATCRAARLRSGSLRNSRRSWCSPSRPDTRSRTPRLAPACAWRCSSEWQWPSVDGCLPWVSAFNRTEWHSQPQEPQSATIKTSLT